MRFVNVVRKSSIKRRKNSGTLYREFQYFVELQNFLLILLNASTIFTVINADSHITRVIYKISLQSKTK